jgi:uncharacterized protein with gpF-like domain
MAIVFPGTLPKEALAFLKNKGLKPGFNYQDVWREEHGYGFTVAKAMQVDVLESIRGELVKALQEGRTLAQFKKDLTPALQRLGWWGQKEMTDPLTGEVKEVQLGSPRRLRTIYDTNMRQARAAGQWQRAERTKKALPYLKYELGPSKEHRPEHAAWSGMILPVDDPWWNTHMPPNGWGCKCRVRQITRWEFEKTGERLSNPPPDNPREWVNKRTGEVVMVPEGIDPGFDHNPGQDRQRQLNELIQGKLQAADPMIARVAERDLAEYRKKGR